MYIMYIMAEVVGDEMSTELVLWMIWISRVVELVYKNTATNLSSV